MKLIWCALTREGAEAGEVGDRLQECGGKRFRSGFRKRCAGAAAVGDLFTHPRPGRHNGDLAETRSFDENPGGARCVRLRLVGQHDNGAL